MVTLAQRMEKSGKDCAALAERMAEKDENYSVAGAAIGMTQVRAKSVFRTMRKHLGWQAV